MVVLAASVLLAVPPSAGAQSGGLEVELPPNTDCRGAAVIAKTTVVEDAAAANMLAEALRVLSRGGTQRCLLDAGLPPGRGRPQHEAVPPDAVYRSSAGLAAAVYVVGGPAAIPDSWLSEQLGVTGFTRVAGADRWQTQQSVAAAMLALAAGSSVQPYDPASVAAATRALPPNGDCYGTAVLAKLTIAEERAAANMLAAALTAISGDPDSRCLVDVGDPGADRPPSAVAVADAAQASGAYLLGGEVAVPQRWLDRGFDIRLLERISGPDRWATQSAVAETIIEIAKGGTLPHQYVDSSGGRISIYDHHHVSDSVLANPADWSPPSGDVVIKVHWCGQKKNLDTEQQKDDAKQELDDEVADLNQYISKFFNDQSSGAVKLTFKAADKLLIISDDPQIWEMANFSGREGTASQECMNQLVSTNENGYILIDQAGGGGWARLSDERAIQPRKVQYQSRSHYYSTFAHEVGHAWFRFCHPHEGKNEDRGCDERHVSLVYSEDLNMAWEKAKQDNDGRNARYKPSDDKLWLCALMSYCYEHNGHVDEYNDGEPIFFSCGQRKIAEWPDGPATPYGYCDDGELKRSFPTPNISSITSEWPVTENRDRPDVLIVYDDSRWPSCVTHVQVAMEKHPTLTNIEREEKWESVSSSQSLRYAVDKSSTYSARLRYRCGSDGIESDWSGKRTFKTPPGPTVAPGRPGKPVLSSRDTDFISITWPEASGVVTYHEVNWRRADSGSSWDSDTLLNALAIFGTEGLSSGVCYEFRVRAGNGEGASDWSESAEFCTTITMRPEVGRPSVIAGDGQLSVSWSATAGNGAAVSGYEVRWRRGSDKWADAPVSGTSYTISSVVYGSRYEVQVRARNSAGWGDWSPSEYMTPPPPPGSVRISEGPVNASRTAAGSCSGNDCYDLTYDIRNLGGGPYTLECWFNGSRAWRGQWSGRASTGCYYSSTFSGSAYVVIDDVKSNTLPIEEKNQRTNRVRVPDPPRRPSVTGGDGQLTVSWNAPSGNGAAIAEYDILVDGSDVSVNTQTFGATSTTVTRLSNGATYTVKVRARNSAGWGDWSQSALGTPEALPVGSVRISEGPVSASRTAAGSCSGNDCYDLSYTIRNLGSGPYTLECWFNGSRAWRGQWSGNASTGCYYSSTFSGSVYVVIDDVQSNTLSVSAKASTQQSTEKVTIARGSRNSRSNCASPCYDLDYRIEGLGGGPYTLECWFNGSRAWRGQWSGRVSTGCYFSGTFRGTVHVVIDGVKSNTLTF